MLLLLYRGTVACVTSSKIYGFFFGHEKDKKKTRSVRETSNFRVTKKKKKMRRKCVQTTCEKTIVRIMAC